MTDKNNKKIHSRFMTHETKTEHTHEADRQVALDAAEGRGHVIRSMDELKELMEAARKTHEAFKKIGNRLMNQHRAAYVKNLRENGHSWRSIAQECYDSWRVNDTENEWWPPSNQIMGMVLCEIAAKDFYGQDYMKDAPWN